MVISIEPLDAVGQGEPPSAVRAVSRIARDDEMNEFDLSGDVSPESVQSIVEAIKRDGFAFVRGFLTPDEVTSIRGEVMEIWNRVDGERMRRSVYPVDSVKTGLYRKLFAIGSIMNRIQPRRLADGFFGEPWLVSDVLSIETEPSADPITHWHADATEAGMLDSEDFTLKYHCYLNDVTSENGAFAYVAGTHNLMVALRGAEGEAPRRLCAWSETLAEYEESPSRLAVEQRDLIAEMKSHIESDYDSDGFYDLEGPAGSAVIFDDRGIHRGGTVVRGHRSILRYALMLQRIFGAQQMKKHMMIRKCLRSIGPASMRGLM